MLTLQNNGNTKMLSSSYFKKNTVTRESLARAVKRVTGLTVNKSATIVDQLIDSMVAAIKDDVTVKIRLLGTFSTKRKSERMGRNPKTMVEAKIPARKVVRFRVAPTLKKKINSNIS